MIQNIVHISYFYLLLAFLDVVKQDQLYLVKGTIQEIKLDDKEVIIAHDTIKGLMLPMTMPFPISTYNNMDGFKRGDSVHFDFQWSEIK